MGPDDILLLGQSAAWLVAIVSAPPLLVAGAVGLSVGLFQTLTQIQDAAFAFVFWTARYGDTANRVPIIISIPGSAAGLTRGSPILFNGIRVGDVTRVALDAQNPQLAFAEAEVDRQTPIKPSTRAALTVQGLTGQAYVELTGGLGTEPNLITEDMTDPLVINADPSFFTDVAASTRALLARADTVLEQIDRVTDDIGSPLVETVRNAETFTGALAARTDEIDAFLASVGEMGTAINQIATRADPLLARIEQPARRDTLISTASQRDGATVHRLDIHLQGDRETVFLDM